MVGKQFIIGEKTQYGVKAVELFFYSIYSLFHQPYPSPERIQHETFYSAIFKYFCDNTKSQWR